MCTHTHTHTHTIQGRQYSSSPHHTHVHIWTCNVCTILWLHTPAVSHMNAHGHHQHSINNNSIQESWVSDEELYTSLTHLMYVCLYVHTWMNNCTLHWPPPTQHHHLILTTYIVCSPHSLASNTVLCRALLPSHCLHILTRPMQLQSTTSEIIPQGVENTTPLSQNSVVEHLSFSLSRKTNIPSHYDTLVTRHM